MMEVEYLEITEVGVVMVVVIEATFPSVD